MIKKQLLTYLFIFLVFAACTHADNTDNAQTNSPELTKLDTILLDMYRAHGELGNYRFSFRDNKYSFQFGEDSYCYTKTVQNDSVLRQDTLTNNGFVRYENNIQVDLTTEEQSKYSESLNSVIYFVCLPLKLQDPATNKQYLGEGAIKSESYHIIQVYFDEEGGGEDHDDVFCYWVNENTSQVDYLAYQYATDGGGVRFRTAYNSRMVGTMRFQDYVNYEAPVGTDLIDLPILFALDSLKELSLIVTEDIAEFSN